MNGNAERNCSTLLLSGPVSQGFISSIACAISWGFRRLSLKPGLASAARGIEIGIRARAANRRPWVLLHIEGVVRRWKWSERYPAQPEILRYLNYVADRLDLKRDIRFNSRVTAAQYDEPANLWRVVTDDGAGLTPST